MILLALLLLFSPLCAEEEFSLVNLSKTPIAKVAGDVNVVSGNWVDQHVHQEVSGPDAIPVAHSYVSSSLEEGSLADGWDLSQHNPWIPHPHPLRRIAGRLYRAFAPRLSSHRNPPHGTST